MLTDQEARTKWCPMVRIARREEVLPRTGPLADPDGIVVVAGCNTDALGRMRVPASCRCIASDCAMWVWSRFDHPNANDMTHKVGTVGRCGLINP